jgi:LAO/AO transport system kinase
MVDFFLLFLVRAMNCRRYKRGIMEMADAIINKADGDNIKRANLAKLEFNRALHLFPAKKIRLTPTTAACSAINEEYPMFGNHSKFLN